MELLKIISIAIRDVAEMYIYTFLIEMFMVTVILKNKSSDAINIKNAYIL